MYLYVCMYACVHACMFVFMYTCMYVCMYVRMYVRTYVRMYVCIFVCMYVCMYVRMYECMNVWMYECMYVCMYVCMYACPTWDFPKRLSSMQEIKYSIVMHYGVLLATPPYFRSSTINVARCIICIHPTTIISWFLKSHQIPDLCYNKYQ